VTIIAIGGLSIFIARFFFILQARSNLQIGKAVELETNRNFLSIKNGSNEKNK
jgi:hypothetical protein